MFLFDAQRYKRVLSEIYWFYFLSFDISLYTTHTIHHLHLLAYFDSEIPKKALLIKQAISLAMLNFV